MVALVEHDVALALERDQGDAPRGPAADFQRRLTRCARRPRARPKAPAQSRSYRCPFSPVMTQDWNGSTFHEKSRKNGGWSLGPIEASKKTNVCIGHGFVRAMLTGLLADNVPGLFCRGFHPRTPAEVNSAGPPPDFWGPNPKKGSFRNTEVCADELLQFTAVSRSPQAAWRVCRFMDKSEFTDGVGVLRGKKIVIVGAPERKASIKV